MQNVDANNMTNREIAEAIAKDLLFPEKPLENYGHSVSYCNVLEFELRPSKLAHDLYVLLVFAEGRELPLLISEGWELKDKESLEDMAHKIEGYINLLD